MLHQVPISRILQVAFAVSMPCLLGCNAKNVIADSPTESVNVTPATVKQATDTIDLDQLEKIGAGDIYRTGPTRIEFIANEDPSNVIEHYRKSLGAIGWKQVELGKTNPNPKRFVLTKNGFYLTCLFQPAGKRKVAVNLENIGNVDMRTLPVFPRSKIDTRTNLVEFASFSSTADAAKVAEYCLDEMKARGWKQLRIIGQNHSLPSPSRHNRIIPFCNNAVQCYLSVTSSGGKTNVYYSPLPLLDMDLPIFDDAESIVFDSEKHHLSYKSAATIRDLADFFRGKCAVFGWNEEADKSIIRDTSGTLVFAVKKIGVIVDLRAKGSVTHVDLTIVTLNVATEKTDL